MGKTCVVQNFKSGNFSEKQQNTIGVDFTVRTVDVEGRKVKVGSFVGRGLFEGMLANTLMCWCIKKTFLTFLLLLFFIRLEMKKKTACSS